MAATIAPADLDAAIISYLSLLRDEEKEAILNLMKAFAPVPDAGDHWDDPQFVAEMEGRYEDYKSGRNTSTFKNVDSAMDHLNSGVGK
jgi:hypothetical protein